MKAIDPPFAAHRILVVMPNWLGDAVMATPFLKALRGRYPRAKITAMHNALTACVLSGSTLVDETLAVESVKAQGGGGNALAAVRQRRFDLAVILPNSFRSALWAFRAGIPNRLGYAREWRGRLLTHRLRPPRRDADQQRQWREKMAVIRALHRELRGRGINVNADALPRRAFPRALLPIPTIDYYLALAEILGADTADRTMTLGVAANETAEAADVLARLEIGATDRLVMMFPGANFGASKCWPAERFANVAWALADRDGDFQATVLLGGSPAERPLVLAILEAARALADAAGRPKPPIHALTGDADTRVPSLGAVKALVARSCLMICNDTGPRHFAAAFGVPVVTLFGPTDPVWAEIFFAKERQIRIDAPCSPCQLKRCPIDHRCMTGITAPMVLNAAGELCHLRNGGPGTSSTSDGRDDRENSADGLR